MSTAKGGVTAAHVRLYRKASLEPIWLLAAKHQSESVRGYACTETSPGRRLIGSFIGLSMDIAGAGRR